jgi:23S rRNA (cytosine1962-C5)-methyltransferase
VTSAGDEPGDPGPIRVHLRPGREASVAGGHPWIFSGAIDRTESEPAPGAEVQVLEAGGRPLARGLWNPHSQIRIRVHTLDPEQPLDRAFWADRLDRALAARRDLPGLRPDAPLRLVFSEADGLSGLVVDRFDRWLVVQFTSLALHERLELWLELLEDRLSPEGILLRTEKGMLEEEGLEASDGVLRGREPEGPVALLDAWGYDGDEGAPLRFLADLRTGQKTGFYLDQRMNRRAVARWAEGRRVADVCCYSGGFALHAARAGASEVVGVDTSAPALDLARANADENGLGAAIRWEKSDALGWLRAEAEGGRTHDLIVLDPPRFARSRRGVSGALRGYGRLNEAAVRLLEPGGLLATFSCSGRVDREAFIGVLAGVSARTGRRLRILESYGQPGDHPVDPNTPETAYLKGLLLRVE